MKIPEAAAEDIVQNLRIDFLFPKNGMRSSRLMSYHGLGPLHAWLRMVCIREGIRYLHQQKRRNEIISEHYLLHSILTSNQSPELTQFMKSYANQIRGYLDESFNNLSMQKRMVLRYYFVFDFSIDKIAALYHIHRVTASRRIIEAKKEFLNHFERLIRTQLTLSNHSIELLLEAMQQYTCLSFFLSEKEV